MNIGISILWKYIKEKIKFKKMIKIKGKAMTKKIQIIK
jgi:hypothetical protein